MVMNLATGIKILVNLPVEGLASLGCGQLRLLADIDPGDLCSLRGANWGLFSSLVGWNYWLGCMVAGCGEGAAWEPDWLAMLELLSGMENWQPAWYHKVYRASADDDKSTEPWRFT